MREGNVKGDVSLYFLSLILIIEKMSLIEYVDVLQLVEIRLFCLVSIDVNLC